MPGRSWCAPTPSREQQFTGLERRRRAQIPHPRVPSDRPVPPGLGCRSAGESCMILWGDDGLILRPRPRPVSGAARSPATGSGPLIHPRPARPRRPRRNAHADARGRRSPRASACPAHTPMTHRRGGVLSMPTGEKSDQARAVEAETPECPRCRGVLDVHQPDTNRPARLLGTCGVRQLVPDRPVLGGAVRGPRPVRAPAGLTAGCVSSSASRTRHQARHPGPAGGCRSRDPGPPCALAELWPPARPPRGGG